MRPGPRNLITDVPGLRVGNAADARLKSGTTVLTADRRLATEARSLGQPVKLLAIGRVV